MNPCLAHWLTGHLADVRFVLLFSIVLPGVDHRAAADLWCSTPTLARLVVLFGVTLPEFVARLL
eukprot:4713553-Pyramimonas_sp.AAC.1